MKRLALLLLVVGCDSGPSKEESIQIYSTAFSALNSGQSAAVTAAGGGDAELQLDYAGPCSLGGSLTLVGSYLSGDADSSDEAAFDLAATFDSCKEATGTIDGELRWSAVSNPDLYSFSMEGDLDWSGTNGSGSCELDVTFSLSQQTVSYQGSLCGHRLTSDIVLPGQ